MKVLRDQHFAQLKPVLRAESSNLHELAVAIGSRAHISAVVHSEPAGHDAQAMLWPDGLSKDLSRHFPEYESAKQKLLSDINIQDQEFRDAVVLAKKSIQPNADLSDYSRELVARSVVDQCTGVGTGMKLTITPDGFQFAELGGTSSNTGPKSNPPRPSPDIVARFRAFQSLKPDSLLETHCQTLKNRADVLRNKAEELSTDARAFAQGAILNGTCDFIHD